MRTSAPLWLLALCGLIFLASCGPDKPEAVVEAEQQLPEKIDFNLHIKPILSDRCFPCHGPDINARKVDFRLDTEEGAFARLTESVRNYALVPGNLSRSEVFHRLVSDDPGYRMPPPESNLSIAPEEIATILKWIEQGAEYKPHWSLIPPEKPPLPDVEDAGWSRNGVDRFVLARLEREGLKPAEEAAKETLIRRVTFDLTGLPPTIEEIDAFLADNSADAYSTLVDRLLASEAYGERMATEWLDVARYADSHGYQDDGMRNMWPWRDWVIEAFNKNLPFDEFVTWQLAGDLLPDATHEQRLATGFNRNHLQSQEGGIIPEEFRVDYVADRTETFGKAFLGLTVRCARCHDHKFDALSQKEYYQLFAFFNSVNEFGNIPYSGEASPTVILIDEEAQQKLGPLQEQIRDYEAQTSLDNAAFDEGFAQCRGVQQKPALRRVRHLAASRRSAARRHARATPGDGLQPQPPPKPGRRHHPRRVPRRLRGRPHRDLRQGFPRPDGALRPLPRSQVRRPLAERVLPALRLLQQRQRVRQHPLLRRSQPHRHFDR